MAPQLLGARAADRPSSAPVGTPRRVWSSNPVVVLWGTMVGKKVVMAVTGIVLVGFATTYAARTMRWSGVILALFIVYHLLHLTAGVVGFRPGGSATCRSTTTSWPPSRSGTSPCSTSWRWPACACTWTTASGANSRRSGGTTPGRHAPSRHFRGAWRWSCSPALSPCPLPCWPGGCAEGACHVHNDSRDTRGPAHGAGRCPERANRARRLHPAGADRTEVGPLPLGHEVGGSSGSEGSAMTTGRRTAPATSR